MVCSKGGPRKDVWSTFVSDCVLTAVWIDQFKVPKI